MNPELDQCIEKTIRAEKELTFGSKRKTDHKHTVDFSDTTINTTTYSYLYTLNSLECRGCHFLVNCTYSEANDKNRNEILYSHTFGGLNVGFSNQQKKIAKAAMEKLENSLHQQCAIDPKAH
jgi:hypothetical protein